MNKRSTTIVRNPILNDFVYTVLYNASYEQKRGLMGKYLKAAMSQKSARAFVAHSTRDEKEYILSHLGFEFFYVVAKRGLTMKSMHGILEKFDNKKQVSAIKDIADAGLLVMGDREFLRLLGFMSKTIHHPTYFMNLEILKQGYNIRNWAKRAHIEEDLKIREMDECARLYAKTAVNCTIALDFVPSAFGITKNSMKILLYLYYYKGVQISDEEIYDHFSVNFKKTEYRYAMKELISGEMIMRVQGKTIYAISGRGVKAVNDFLNSINKLNEI